MQKSNLEHLELDVFEETLENGFRLFVVPMEKSNGIYATYTTNYGSMIEEFLPVGKEEFVKVPAGIAHFLEHKLFEQETGEDPFTFYGKTGSDCNANTSNYKTTYLFSGPNCLKENLSYLLKFVGEPYFTEESVEKEKGIIEQEIEMNADNPDWVGMDSILKNAFQKNPIRIPIPGTKESIQKITKEDLFLCYQTFYQPSNMFCVVTGNVDPEEVLETVRSYPFTKEKKPLPVVQTYEEPDEVGTEFEQIKLNVTIPKVLFAYKFRIADTGVSRTLAYNYISLLANLKFGPISEFVEQMKEEKILTYPMDYDLVYTDQHILLIFFGETKEPEQLIEKIKEEMKKDDVLKKDFDRKKKTLLSSCIYMTDDIYRVNHKIINDLILEGKVNTQVYSMFRDFSFSTFEQIKNQISYQHTTTFVILPKEEK